MRSTSRAWVPLIFVAAALVLLLGTPLVVHHETNRLRGDVIDIANEARLLVSEFQAAFAEELVLTPRGPGLPASDDSIRRAAIGVERADALALDSVAARLGSGAVERVIQLRSAEQRWRASATQARQHPGSPEARDEWASGGREVLAAADSLHQYVLAIWTQGRARVRFLEQVNVASAVALTPIALIALGIVVHLERQMRAYAAEAGDRAEKLERSVELRATLIHGVVHDIKNPLGAASGYAELLDEGLAGPMNDQQTEMVRRMKRLVGTAQGTVGELVDLARVDAGEYPIDRRETDLVGAVREIAEDYQAQATQKSIQLTFETTQESLRAVTDAIRVRHVVENLLSNAIKYTPEHGRVRVWITMAPTDSGPRIARVAVQDSGPGVPPEYRDRIFDAFFRMPSSERSAAGSGLGLAVSRRIARLLGGDVTVDSADGRGSVFTLSLPVDQPTAIKE